MGWYPGRKPVSLIKVALADVKDTCCSKIINSMAPKTRLTLPKWWWAISMHNKRQISVNFWSNGNAFKQFCFIEQHFSRIQGHVPDIKNYSGCVARIRCKINNPLLWRVSQNEGCNNWFWDYMSMALRPLQDVIYWQLFTWYIPCFFTIAHRTGE